MEKVIDIAFRTIIAVMSGFIILCMYAAIELSQRESACINGVVMYKTDKGWESDGGRYVQFCAEGKQ